MQSYFSKLYDAFPCYPAPPEGKAFAYVEEDSILFVFVINKNAEFHAYIPIVEFTF